MKITARITEINERIDLLMSKAVDDFTSTILMTEVQDLIAEKYRLEGLLLPRIDVKCSTYYINICTCKFVPFKDFINNCHLN